MKSVGDVEAMARSFMYVFTGRFMFNKLLQKVRQVFKANLPRPSAEYKTPPEMLEEMRISQSGTDGAGGGNMQLYNPKELEDFPTGLYENSQGDRIYFEGFVPYGDETLALFREMYQQEWQLQESGAFLEEFFDSGGAVNVVPITMHKRW